ncbi:hypothetical protein ATCV1_z586L [Acanthocystis turfacea chlorella virus 1]|uniref:Uncharacterized protein z586L n=1 Tax=Chlorovirus heliozoae TaxID=322019 RepID=A7K9J6_9PHYC|nr:hypothetical protein ATCV1_z586L [Acanthocystis turfacea chlorella virus 1]ABT16720.1 hypothetical protein ATCV1_z586L [Acanthocystis turfacea chlorella virus 1]
MARRHVFSLTSSSSSFPFALLYESTRRFFTSEDTNLISHGMCFAQSLMWRPAFSEGMSNTTWSSLNFTCFTIVCSFVTK